LIKKKEKKTYIFNFKKNRTPISHEPKTLILAQVNRTHKTYKKKKYNEKLQNDTNILKIKITKISIKPPT
jgi:hypothetical protein